MLLRKLLQGSTYIRGSAEALDLASRLRMQSRRDKFIRQAGFFWRTAVFPLDF